MSTIYNALKNNFTQVSNHALLDVRLSAKAKMLYAYMCYRLGISEKWEFIETEILKHFKEKRDAMREAKNELIEFGYLVKIQTRNDKGFFQKNDYEIFAESQPVASDPSPEKPSTGSPSTDEPSSGKPSTENASYNNKEPTNKDSTNKDLTNKTGAAISWKEILKGGGLSNEKKVWSVAEVYSFLSSETIQRIQQADLDIDVLLRKYVIWINKPEVGKPKNFDNAFPRWVENFEKIKLPKLVGSDGLKTLSFDKWEEDAKVREKIKTLMHYFPNEEAQIFAVAPLSKTDTSWQISLSEANFEKLFKHQELLSSINVKIELKP